MKILFNTISGSKLYGTDNTESDTDVKSVFLPPLQELLAGKGVKNIAYTTGNDKSKNSKADLDHEYIPLQVLAKDFLKGQTYALEIVFSALTTKDHPYSDAIEILDPNFYEFCEELAEYFLTSNIKAMLGYAYGQTHKYGIKGLRYKSILIFDDMINQTLSNDYDVNEYLKNTELFKNVSKLNDNYLKASSYEGPDGQEDCIELIGKVYPLSIKLREAHLRTVRLIDSYGSRTKKSMDDGGIDWKAVSHAVRITYQAMDILTVGYLEFPLETERRGLLKEIKAGDYEWSAVEKLIAGLMDNVEVFKKNTRLSPINDDIRESFDIWLEAKLLTFYGLDDYKWSICEKTI